MKEQWQSVIDKLRSCGFFQSEKALNVADLCQKLQKQARDQFPSEEFESLFDPLEVESFELSIAALDKSRVWWSDLETSIDQKSKTYEQLLNDFALLSGGHLTPQNVVEQWETASGPISVAFDQDGLRHHLQPHFEYDWIDNSVFDAIEEILRNKRWPYNFYAYIGRADSNEGFYGQDVFLLRANESEREKLQQLLNWKLMPNLA